MRKASQSALITTVAEKYPMIKVITYIVGLFDPYGIDHSERVAVLSVDIGKVLGLSPAELEELELAALLHDIGKLGIPESIRAKPGALTEAEYSLMQQHVIIGKRILERMNGSISVKVHEGLFYHHERWDGSGYPEGLVGEAAPLYSRIIGVADSFDALTHTRGYRLPTEVGAAIEKLEKEQQEMSIYDPRVFEIFLDIMRNRNVQ